MTTKTTELQIKSIDTPARRCSCIASTDSLDSYQERIDQATWNLDLYRVSPVVLFAHDTRSLPVGRAENVRVEDGALQAEIIFASAEANPEAEKVWKLVQEKILRGVSVGFKPGRISYEKEGGKEIARLHNCILRELSVVPIGANPDALIRSRDGLSAKATPDVRPVVSIDDQIKSLLADGTIRAHERELIALARTNTYLFDRIVHERRSEKEMAAFWARTESKVIDEAAVERRSYSAFLKEPHPSHVKEPTPPPAPGPRDATGDLWVKL